MRRTLHVLSLVAGCGLSAGCDEIVNVRNVAPEVTVDSLCTVDDRLFIEISVRDYERDPVDVAIIVADGDAPFIAVPGPTGDGVIGLTSDRTEPVVHRIELAAPSVCVDDPESAARPCHPLTDLEAALGSEGVELDCECTAPTSRRFAVAASDGDKGTSVGVDEDGRIAGLDLDDPTPCP
jgi:hypothetical protein